MAVKVSRSVKSERIWRFFVFTASNAVALVPAVGNGALAAYVQMAVDVRGHLDVRVAEPLLHVFQAVALRQQHAGAGVPLRYNYDKPEKPRRIKGFEVFSLVFSSFSKPKNHN